MEGERKESEGERERERERCECGGLHREQSFLLRHSVKDTLRRVNSNYHTRELVPLASGAPCMSL